MDPSHPQEKKSIPRFASFKPRPAPPPEADRPSERERQDRSSHRSTRRHSRHRSHRDRSRSRERRRERHDHRHSRKDGDHSSREQIPAPASPRSIVNTPKDDVPELYIVDTKGDKFNVLYGTINRYSIPLYYRFGRGSVLGLPPSHKIDRDTAEGDTIVVKADAWRTNGSKVKANNLLAGLRKQRTKLLRIRQTAADTTVSISDDYLPLNGSGSKHKEPEDVDSEDDKYAYRSIRGKAKPEDMLPSDLEQVSDSGSGGEGGRVDPDKDIQKRNVELTRHVDQNPTDIATWLHLIDHQELLLRGSERESSTLTYAEKKSLADIKLSLYEKALKKVGQNPSRDKLLLGLLEEGAKLWDTKKLSAQWRSLLKSNSHFITLWVKYLDFRQTEFLDFTYEKCLATFLECFKLIRSAPDNPKKGYIQAYLFLRLTLFIREAGFTEHAVGLWQSVLELSFFQPENLDETNALPALMDFWDSEVARIGELGAKGWSRGNHLVSPRVFHPESTINTKSLLASWVDCERERIVNARLPGRSLDEEDDPYRVVLSSDIQEIVSLVWTAESTHALVDGFLYYCHLPPIITTGNVETTCRWVGDGFLRNDFTSSSDYTLEEWLSKSSTGDETSGAPFLSFHHQNFIHTLGTLFTERETWFYSLGAWVKGTVDRQSDITPEWARRTLRLLVESMPQNDELAEYSLAVEFACNRKEAKKYAKSLLKKRSSNLRLYNAYAVIERRLGNHTAADHVWTTTLSMSKTFSDYGKLDTIVLWGTWIWELLEARDIAHASHVLISMPQNDVDLKAFSNASDQTVFTATSLLKIRNFLSETMENVLANKKAGAFVACVDCQAIQLYLTHSLDLTSPLESYQNAFKRLSALPPQDHAFIVYTTELLYQSRARLLYHHVRTNGVYKPSTIRSILSESISSFPHNTIFLSLFAWNEARFRIEERVRDTIKNITTETRNRHTLTTAQVPITSHLFSIYIEMIRPVYAGSTVHSVRAAFEKAIGDQETSAHHNTLSTARSNLSLWKLYILFELSHNDIHRAMDIFYRGMRACPWSKELIMVAFSHLRADVVQAHHPSRKGDGMGFDELRRVYNVLVEKELRIHIDIEDQLDDMMDQMHRSSALGLPFVMPVDADSEDEQMQL
ncbi:hypothetical protein FE257_010979 [Aspergillus nanangensis]|uniref:DUF1740-domain-containing protein n=1 Tax=Aspergillus nanangensis TaxID=2582783 RepID=A0AAD4GRS4_ASPNN|nr:hypothetical protein FE257_010979 [Aspergillus nanangensis]